jgi:hypothetical protein
MNLRLVRYIYGLTILITYFITVLIFFLYGVSLYPDDPAEIVQGILVVAPVAAIYVTPFVKYVARNRTISRDEVDQRMDYAPFSVQYAIIIMFGLGLTCGSLYLFHSGVLKTTNIKLFVSIVDTIFAVYMGIIFEQLFPISSTSPETSTQAGNPAADRMASQAAAAATKPADVAR